jgi:3-oxoadipate enol-lactonase
VGDRSVAACEVHYERSGPSGGPAVILAPSLGTELSMWEAQASELARRFQVIRYDLRGHGRSPVPAGPYSIAELGADLLALLDRLGLERASLCGISIADAVLARWFTPAFANANPDVVEPMRARLIGTPREGYAGCCEALAAMDLRAALTSIEAPTMVIAGRDDPALPPAHSRLIADAIPGARLEVVPDAAHLANIEQPNVVGELIAHHLDPN